MMALVSVFAATLLGLTVSAVASNERADTTVSMAVGDTATLQSPNFPQNYPESYRYQWEYSCPDENDNVLELQCSVFHLQSSADCVCDRLIVTSRGQRDVKCGSDSPDGTITATGWMRLTFFSNSDTVKQGFDCTITCTARPSPTSTDVSPTTSAGTAPLTCGTHTLTAGEQVAIQTPNFPQPYSTDYRCQWELSCPTESDHTLSFNCPTFELESSENCVWDRLIVASRGSRDVKCGSDSPDGTVTSTGWARLTFFSNDFTVDQGFLCYITCQAN